ncbi:MAG: LysM peptidoglycan-binding domain-containing protein, partial [Tidjanibacter sp.]|nr:LysM peptidoglycan-binding domain-containing protein [Tidjanibacter sp.]
MAIRSRVIFLLAALVGCANIAGAQNPAVRSEVVISIDGRNFFIHTTQEGQSVGDIATLYSLDEGEVRQENSLTQNDTLAVGRVLRVPCYERISRLAPKRGDSRYDR